MVTRIGAWLLSAGLLLSACAVSSDVAEDDGRDRAPPWPWELAEAGQDVPASVPLEQIRPGGPPPDGIPPIDQPVFESVRAARSWLDDRSPVMVLELPDRARAYPLAILTFHEIVNDRFGDRPVLITYCPLCNSALAFDRTLNGRVDSFGTSGRLWRSNLVMYDRRSRSLWSQFTGEAIVGPRLGEQLRRLPAQIVSLREFAGRWPDGDVLSRDTGHERDYGSNPYVGYDSSSAPFLFDEDTPGPLPQIARVIATGGAHDPVAYPLSLLRDRRVVQDVVDGTPVVVWWTPGTASALDSEEIDAGADVGATGVFQSMAGARPLTFTATGDARFTDQETGSTWTVLGHAVSGPLAGAQLERVAHDDTFWFVQYAFRPQTRIFGRGPVQAAP